MLPMYEDFDVAAARRKIEQISRVTPATLANPATLGPESSRLAGLATLPVEIPHSVDTESDAFHERAGIVFDNLDIPREWVDGFAVLVSMPCPDRWLQSNWDKVLIAGETFLTEWGDKAHKLGWTVKDLFGVSVKGSYARLDCRGLVLALGDKRVTALTAETAVLQCLNPHSGEPTGSTLKYYRKTDMSKAVPVWELAS